MIKIGILGYGNLGRGVEAAIENNPDMQLSGIFTRRNPSDLIPQSDTDVYHADKLIDFKEKIDMLILCGGSATDLPEDSKKWAEHFNIIDSFDTHANIPAHFSNVDKAATVSGHIALISCGWDPGMFSLARVYSSSILPDGKSYTFWGKGVSQGHSDAIRRIEGVIDARQYTIPISDAIDKVRNIGADSDFPELSTGEKHRRECFVVAKEGADLERIEQEIKTMPNYFADYDTTVHFISAGEMAANHSSLPHGGVVIHSGRTSEHSSSTIEYSLKLDSNPEFTGSVIVAFARALYRMNERGIAGCKTVFDIAPGDLSPLSSEELRRTML